MPRSTWKPIIFLVLTLYNFSSPSIAADTLNPTQSLSGNQTLISSGGSFALGFFSPPGSHNRYVGVWYNKITIQTITWVANRENPVTDSTGTLSLTATGSLTVTNRTGAVLWSTAGAAALSNPVAQLLDTGNFVVKNSGDGDVYAWQSFDHPTDTLTAGMKIGVDFNRGVTTTLTAWNSASDPSAGQYNAAFDVTGDPEIYLYGGNSKIWRTGPWDGIQFSGIPDTTTYENFTFSFVATQQEISYSFNVTNPSIISRLVVNSSGVVQRAVWIDGASEWNFFWYAPRDQCDDLSECGPYGVCDPNNSPSCDCLQGFTPRYPANWALRDGSGGCVRKTGLDCRNGTDGFATVSGAKLPDTSNCTVDKSLSLDACRAKCLGNCSCTGYAAANISGGDSGCVIWVAGLTDIRVYTDAGQDLYVRLAAADLVSTSSQTHKSQLATAAIVVSVLLVALLLTGAMYYLWRKKTKRRGFPSTISYNEHCNDENSTGNELELPLLDMETIVAATGNFSLSNKLGEGGFGPVYKGTLGEEQEIAVKRLGKTSVQGLDEFKNEVMLIAKLQHRNLVRLLGCCIQGAERLLIYEYMPNRSLDAFLFDKTRVMFLDWQTRYNIIAGTARGLLYLHQDSRLRIIHRDLKAGNILLDKEMNPKISDFGMARIFGGEETEASTRRIVGTYGYMSPEYAMDGIFSVKSDVFSFGVLLLEILSGKKNRGAYHTTQHVNLLGHAWSLWNEGNSLQLVDESMEHPFSVNEVLKCMKIGLLCVQEHPEDRPLMSDVVLMLGSDNVSLPNPKQPGFAMRRFPIETESSSSKQELSAHNDMSFTMFEGR